MSKTWYTFKCTEVEAVISVCAVDERAARGCLNLLLKFYNAMQWKLTERRITIK